MGKKKKSIVNDTNLKAYLDILNNPLDSKSNRIQSYSDILKLSKKDKNFTIYDEDGYELTHPDDIKEFQKRQRLRQKEIWLKKRANEDYELSRLGQVVVDILKEKGEMKNVDIIDEIRKRGYNNNATHINKFFKSNDGKIFYKEKLIGNKGYWSLKDEKVKLKTVSIPIMITNKMKIELGLLGYTKDDIRNLTPIKANNILSNNIILSKSKERGKNQ